MWKGHDIRHFQQWGVSGQPFFLKHIEAGSAQMAGLQRPNQRGFGIRRDANR
jgi:hypothetical protein